MVGDKPYLLAGDSRDLRAYAGGKATVTGVAVNDQIEVQTASNANHSLNAETRCQMRWPALCAELLPSGCLLPTSTRYLKLADAR